MAENRETIAREIVTHQFPPAPRLGDKYAADEVDDRLDQIVVDLRSEVASDALASDIDRIQFRVGRGFFRSGYPVDAVDRFLADITRRLRGN